jgi:DNA replication protein DnaC
MWGSHDRHAARSAIFTSQLPIEEWHDYVADSTIADALLDRVVHNAHRIELKGPSRRKPEA